MPFYDVKCRVCGEKQEIFRKLSEFDNLPQCCGEKMQRQLTVINVQQDIAPYRSQITGEMITSRSQHRRHLKQHKCIEVGNEKFKTVPQDKKFEWSAAEKHSVKTELSQRLN